MGRHQQPSLLLPCLSALLLVLAFPRASLFWLAWVGLVPFLFFLFRKPNWARTLLGHALLGLLFFGGVLYWIPRVLVDYGALNDLEAAGAFLAMLVALCIFLLPFTLLTRWMVSRSNSLALVGAPAFWTLTEILRNYFAVNGFPWASLGYSQYPDLSLIQTADLGGVFLVSWLLVAGNCGLLAIWLKKWKFVGCAAGLLLVAHLYGVYRLRYWEPLQGPALKVGLVQGDLKVNADLPYYAEKYFEDLPRLFQRAVREGARWVIFPEATNPYSFPDDFYFRTFWERRVQEAGVFLLFNATFQQPPPSQRYFNSAFLLNPEGRAVYRYDKNHLVPFGEYVPMANWLSFASPLVKEVSSFSAGSGSRPGRIGGTLFGTLICYEAIFPELSRRAVGQGAELLVNITNDTWYGATAAPYQHFQMAVFRAIETRRPMLRCANSGVTAVIDLKGRIRGQLKMFQEGVLVESIRGSRTVTLFELSGQWPVILIIIVSTLLSLGLSSRNRKPVKRSK